MFAYIVFFIIIVLFIIAIIYSYQKEQIEKQKIQQDKNLKKEIEEQRIKEEIIRQREIEEQRIKEEIIRQREIEVKSIKELIKHLKEFAERKRLQEIKQQQEELAQQAREQEELQRQYEIKTKFGTMIQDFIKAKRKLKKIKSNEYCTGNMNEESNFINKLHKSMSFDYYFNDWMIDCSIDYNCEINYHLSVDLHGFTLNDVKTFYPKLIEFCSAYHLELTVIHGYNNGTILRDYVRNFRDKSIVSMKHDILNLGMTKFIIYNENRIKERQLKEERKEIERKNQIIQLETDIKVLSEKLKKEKITISDIKKYFLSLEKQ
jgi:hypothetical protein